MPRTPTEVLRVDGVRTPRRGPATPCAGVGRAVGRGVAVLVETA